MSWRRYLVYETVCLKTTWVFRIGVVIGFVLLLALTSPLWTALIGQTLVCRPRVDAADAILVDNFELNYLVFEQTADVQSRGLGGRVLVPAQASPDPTQPDLISAEIAHLMARVARVNRPELIPVRQIEPISLNAAYQIREYLLKEHVGTVLVVTPAFRSQRSFLIYNSVFAKAGITAYCLPVFGDLTAENWSQSWHGIQQVAEQFLKLQYYRIYVLPLESIRERSRSTTEAVSTRAIGDGSEPGR